MRRWLDLFSGIGIPVAMFHRGGFALQGGGWSHEATFERMGAALSTMTGYAASAGFTVFLGNMPLPSCGLETME